MSFKKPKWLKPINLSDFSKIMWRSIKDVMIGTIIWLQEAVYFFSKGRKFNIFSKKSLNQ